jgi:hypothetical protein
MARASLRDRFFTPPVARAMTSPGGILAAAAGASAAILAGLPLALVGAAGAAAWALRVALAVPRAPSEERIDPFTLSEPWRGFVREAQQAKAAFDDAVRSTKAGPLRERLDEIGARIDDGVRESWRIARAGEALADARSRIDVRDITRQLAELGETLGPGGTPPVPPPPGTPLAKTLEALYAQLDTARRMDAVIADTRDRLRLLDARLDEAVTRAVELSVRAAGPAELGGLSHDVDALVADMEALRQALDETDRPAPTTGTGTPSGALGGAPPPPPPPAPPRPAPGPGTAGPP